MPWGRHIMLMLCPGAWHTSRGAAIRCDLALSQLRQASVKQGPQCLQHRHFTLAA